MESLSSFAKEKIRSVAIDEEEALPDGILDDIAKLGALGMSIPLEYGGVGFTGSAYIWIFSAICRIDTSLVVTVGAHQSLGLSS